jgi:broad specificity phosphatase PhoE
LRNALQLVCVRHGRTAWNASGRFQGHTDIPLDDEGIAQAQALAVHLAAEHFDVGRTSDLSRATVTADAIGEACGIEVVRDPRLREMDFGTWEGKTWPQIAALGSGIALEMGFSAGDYTPPEGESFEHLCERVQPVIAEIVAALPADGNALIVSHAGVMHALMRLLLSPDDPAANTSRFVQAAILRLRGDGTWPWGVGAINEQAAPLSSPRVHPP